MFTYVLNTHILFIVKVATPGQARLSGLDKVASVCVKFLDKTAGQSGGGRAGKCG